MEIEVTATGTRPLLMHNAQLASPLNQYAKQLKAYSSKRTKTEEDRLEIARIEFMGSLYFDTELGPYIPAPMVFANMIEGAKATKNGKKVERGLDVVEFVNPLIYAGPRTMAGLWGDGETEFVDMRSVRVTTSRVDRTRPIFNEWQVQFSLLVDPEILNYDEITRIVHDAGAFAGFGDYRKMFGRYKAEIKKLSD